MHFNQKPRSLESVCTLITDGSHFSPAPQVEGYPIVNAKDIPSGYINLDSCTNISKDDWDTLRKQNCAPAPGDVLLSKDGTIGRVVFYEYDLCVVALSSIAILRPNDSIDPNYLAQVLRSDAFRRQLLVLESGSALKRIILRDIKKLEFYFPYFKSEQTKIAEILSTVDRAIEQTEALIAKQQRIKTGLMQDLLTHGIDKHGNLRSEQTHEFKDSPLGRIPMEWKVESLNSRALVKGGKRLPAGHVYAEGDTGCRYLQTTDFISKRLIYPKLHYLFAKTFRMLERYEITDGDVFISIAGVNLGVTGVFRPDFDDRTILTENAARIHILTDELPEYLAMQINGFTVQRQILEDKGIGAGVPKLALFRIQQFLIPWPTREEQLQIVRRLQLFDGSMQKQKDELRKMRSLKTALMQDLLTGKKRVTALLNDTEEQAYE
jgi:type I restriction enzyme S subunit